LNFVGFDDVIVSLMTYFRVRGFYSIYLGALVGSSTERILIGSNDLHRFWGSSYVGHADDMLKIRGSPHMLHPHALTVDREHSSSPVRLANSGRSIPVWPGYADF